MRTIKEINIDPCRLSIMQYNNKYIFKFERGSLEQNYKISEMDVYDLDGLIELFTKELFLSKVNNRFDSMLEDTKGIMSEY